MQDETIRERLTEIFHDLFGDDTLVLRPEMTTADIDGWDSIKHISLIVAVEDRFRIKMTTAEIDGLKNVGDLERLVRAKSQQAGG